MILHDDRTDPARLPRTPLEQLDDDARVRVSATGSFLDAEPAGDGDE